MEINEFIASAKESYDSKKVDLHERTYTFEDANFKDATKLASFAEKMQGMAWVGSDEFHDDILPILCRHIRYEGMLLSKHDGILSTKDFMKDSLKLFTVAVFVLCYPLLSGVE